MGMRNGLQSPCLDSYLTDKPEVLAVHRELRDYDDRGMRWNREPGVPGSCADHGRGHSDRICDRGRPG